MLSEGNGLFARRIRDEDRRDGAGLGVEWEWGGGELYLKGFQTSLGCDQTLTRANLARGPVRAKGRECQT